MLIIVCMLIATGWQFATSVRSVRRVISFYAIFAAILLIGGPLDYFGLAEGWAAIGTEVL
jgi:hypothetical protein